MTSDYGGYTQRDWERTVGWGKVPDEYTKQCHQVPIGNTDGQDIERSQENREENEEPLEDGKEYKMNDPIWDKRWTE